MSELRRDAFDAAADITVALVGCSNFPISRIDHIPQIFTAIFEATLAATEKLDAHEN